MTIVFQLNSLRERLSEAEAERDRLLAELEELRTARVSGVTCDSEDAEDSDDMLDFPGEPRTLPDTSRSMNMFGWKDSDKWTLFENFYMHVIRSREVAV